MNTPNERAILLLQIIANELYLARVDRDLSKSSDGIGFELWEGEDGGRADMTRVIDLMRDEARVPEAPPPA